MDEIPSMKLNTSVQMPAIGFGTWQIDDGSQAREAVTAALEAGYRLIDTARIYGNEKSVGEAIRESSVARKDIFITTKLWTSDLGYDSGLKAFDESMERLGLDYLDLYLIHWPGHSSKHRLEAWRALEEIKKQGFVKSIGVSNYMVEHLEELLDNSKTVPAVNQIELHPFIYHKQLPIIEFCKQRGIVVEAYSPLARGHHMDNGLIGHIDAKHGKNPAQVMLRWAIQHGTVPIPKSAHKRRIKENLEVFDFELSKEEMHALDSLGGGKSSLPLLIRLLQ